ncbi:methylmalonyl-CoA epimerase [Echinicola pacifica]|uniref:Methylmalonyl-CoA epimerase n=1 Tax=Echinicola pacifica TaxID=346377 RepID=A0A918UXR0_9BACT|nr:methylmalonyl-CoA epimerase [Echinicola pacifica]GGZ40587.1 methylmalonyl-CoA epimerase [Echinicola pacifica]
MRKIEHLGIAVKNLETSKELFSRLLGKDSYKEEQVGAEGVQTAFFLLGETKIELLEALSADSPIAKFLEKKNEGLHHIAIAVDDIYSEMDRLKKEGFELLNDLPKKGADDKLVVFLHPRSTNGVLVELCQDLETEKE